MYIITNYLLYKYFFLCMRRLVKFIKLIFSYVNVIRIFSINIGAIDLIFYLREK